MPTYVYECDECGLRDDVFHGMSEEVELECPCGSVRFHRCITAPNIIIHGESSSVSHDSHSIPDMQQELLDKYGVAEVTPLKREDGQANGFKRIYKEIKESGGFVKERMAERKEQEAKKRNEKMMQQDVGREDRVRRKVDAMRQSKAKESYESRSVKIVSKRD